MYVYRVGVGVDLYNELLRKSGGGGGGDIQRGTEGKQQQILVRDIFSSFPHYSLIPHPSYICFKRVQSLKSSGFFNNNFRNKLI